MRRAQNVVSEGLTAVKKVVVGGSESHHQEVRVPKIGEVSKASNRKGLN